MDDSQLFELVKDDYELDTSNSPPLSYHLLCKRANGYLFIDDSAFQGINMPSAVPIGISENRGKGFGKFIFSLFIIM